MHVLWLADHLGYDGSIHGAGKYFLDAIPAFGSDVSVSLCVLRHEDRLTGRFRAADIEVIHFGRSKFDVRTLGDVRQVISRRKTQVVHAHGYGSTNFARLAAMITGVPVIVHAHDDDRIYPWYQRLADRLLRDRAARAIAVSRSVKAACVSKRRLHPDKVIVMHNGIRLDAFEELDAPSREQERARLGFLSSDLLVGTVGKLREEKGTRYLLEAAPAVLESVPNARFLVVGDGPLRGDLEALARALGLGKHLSFAGFREDIPTVLSILDLVAIPSLTEGSPLALLEAMAMGKPIVATSVGGITEILSDEQTGLIIRPEDPGALAGSIVRLLGDLNAANELGSRAKAESKRYDIRAHVAKLEALYHELAAAA